MVLNSETPAQQQDHGGIPARAVVFKVLDDVLRRKRTMDEAFERSPQFARLETRDRAFAKLLVLTIIRRLGEIDAMISKYITTPIYRLKPENVVDVMRIGAAQILFLDTPPHAAVNTSVDLAVHLDMLQQKGLINAVLRRVAENKADMMPARDAARANTPDWMWNALVADWGVETALGIAGAHLFEAPIDITVKENPEAWATRLDAQMMQNGTLRRTGGGLIQELDGYDEGAWWVQTMAASLPAKLFGDDLRGKTIVDLCAAPGGKTAQLALQGAKVIAVDRSATRMKILNENMKRLGLSVETHVADGAEWLPTELVDGVLVDAPCTATGTIRHQPDVLHLKNQVDVEKLAVSQQHLLQNAVRMLKPGGTLVYSTCSLFKAEGENQAFWSLESDLPIAPKPIKSAEIFNLDSADPFLTVRGEFRSLPYHLGNLGGIDGFFIARFSRV